MKRILATEHLNVGYGKRTVISNVQIDALRGQVICLLGPNGAGKTTILRTLSGLLAPVEGTVFVDGQDLRLAKKKDVARKLSLVLTDSVMPALTTVYALVSMGRTPYTDFLGRLSEEDHRIIVQSLETVGAVHLKDRLFSELSDGEKQKVMIARALVQEPELMILDEPTSHLDIKHKVEVVRVLQKLANEKRITCILSLHDIDLAIKGCQTVLLVSNGCVVAQGAPEEVVREGILQQLYDLQGAEYNELLGLVELRGGSGNQVFVVGGSGTGIHLYRALARKGYGITSGVLHQNDEDYAIAKSICSAVISEKPFEEISAENAAKAEDLMREAGWIVDSGFPVGSGNRENLELLKRAVQTGKTVFSLRPAEEARQAYGACVEGIRLVPCVSELLQQVGELQ